MAAASLAEIPRRFGPDYLATHTLTPAQARVWRAIVACRTAALGGHFETCPACGATRHVYHSCRNRHCPQCQTRAKEAWLAARRREVLPVPYFHLVFTLPHDLNGLTGRYPRRLYETLFGAVSATLTAFAANPRRLGGTPAYTLVLHTWQQDLGRHVHLHALVAGGALSASGDWIAARPGFLFPVRALSRVFRGKFVAALAALYQAGALGGAWPEADWTTLKRQLQAHDWVVYAKAPVGGPAQVLEYLSRYSHRVAISNERLVGLDGDGAEGVVRFRVRADTDGARKRTLSLPATPSSSASCAMSCRRASSASAITACWGRPERRRTWHGRARPWLRRRQTRRWWNRWRRSCAGLSVWAGRAVRADAAPSS